MEFPVHTAVLAVTVIVGVEFTETVLVATFVHPLLPVTVYVIVVVGEAVTLAPVVADRPVPGAQVYVVAPVAISVVGEPEQIAMFAPAPTLGSRLTVTAFIAVFTQPLASVPVTV